MCRSKIGNWEKTEFIGWTYDKQTVNSVALTLTLTLTLTLALTHNADPNTYANTNSPNISGGRTIKDGKYHSLNTNPGPDRNPNP